MITRKALFLMEHAGIDGEFHSFMAVCRSSPPRRLIKGKGDFVSSMGLDKKARLRASQLVSALALSILAKSKTWQTCGMVEQLREGTRPLAMMCLKDGSFSFKEAALETLELSGHVIPLFIFPAKHSAFLVIAILVL